jgi:hypothetical protein
VFPVLGREVIECQKCPAILAQAFGSLVVLDPVAFDEGVECGLGVDCPSSDNLRQIGSI